jgi:hypothetical protein
MNPLQKLAGRLSALLPAARVVVDPPSAAGDSW